MPASHLLRLVDQTYRSAWLRFMRLWRPMILWTLLVWVSVALLLVPLASALLGAAIFRGDRLAVANVDLASWLLHPLGLLYALLAGGLAIIVAVVRYAGLFRIITDDLEGTEVSVRQTLLEILPDLPALFKVCVLSIAGAAVLLAPLAAGLGGIYLLVLGEFDINYYLIEQPPEWRRALILAVGWAALWAVGAVYVVLHTLPTLPAYLDGHRPIGKALRESWRLTRGQVLRILWLVILTAGAWWLIRATAQAALFVTAGRAVIGVEAVASSVTAVALAMGAYAVVSFLTDAAVSFVGFAFVSTLLTKFYHENTDLHAAAPATPPGWRKLPRRAAGVIRTWMHPRRLAPLAGVLLFASGGLAAFVLNEVGQEREVIITAHRAGALLAPENTLAALEAAIEAGAHFAEIDVQRTRDGEVVVVHDADLMRVAGDPRRIAAVNFEDIAGLVQGRSEHPPEERLVATLDQFLDRSRGRIGLNIELKYYGPDPALADSVVSKVRQRGMEDEVVIMALELDAVRQVARLAPDIPVGYVAAVAAGNLHRLPVDFLALSRPLASGPLLRASRARGIEVHVWTLNAAPAIREAVERGVDGIITDDPGLVRQIAEEFAQLSVAERLLLRLRRMVFGETPPRQRGSDHVGVHLLDEGGVRLLDGAAAELHRGRHHAVLLGEGRGQEAEVADALVARGALAVVPERGREQGPRALVRQQGLPVVGDALLARPLRQRVEVWHDQRGEELAALAHHHHLLDQGIGSELLLDRARVDVFAALRHDHVLDPVGDA
jgi:glycerophosphoryl diester phosphodiesterase